MIDTIIYFVYQHYASIIGICAIFAFVLFIVTRKKFSAIVLLGIPLTLLCYFLCIHGDYIIKNEKPLDENTQYFHDLELRESENENEFVNELVQLFSYEPLDEPLATENGYEMHVSMSGPDLQTIFKEVSKKMKKSSLSNSDEIEKAYELILEKANDVKYRCEKEAILNFEEDKSGNLTLILDQQSFSLFFGDYFEN